MSNTPHDDLLESESRRVAAERARDLPPVQPPSAGFIVQLFVIPALIVLAIVGVWALFGRIASSEEDWRELVEDIRNTNEHRRWRGAYGLAMLLERDQKLAENGQSLSTNPDIARALVDVFEQGLKQHSHREDDLKQEAFLARTLGLLDVPVTVLPALEHGMKSDQDREVRKNSIAAVAVIAGRAQERHESLKSPQLVEELITTTHDPDSLIRDTGTYTLGLIPTDASRDRLEALTKSGDANTRINAAIGLARQHSTAGIPVFDEVLATASRPAAAGAAENAEELLALKNTLHAVHDLSDELTPAQRSDLIAKIEPISKSHAERRIRTDAIDALVTLKSGGDAKK